MSETFYDCWFLTGPTAVGKTGVGVALAQRIGAEIISLDSMAIYRGMDIGTAKPSRALREAVPHHLIDIVDPADEFSVAQYVEAAAHAVAEIRSRGRQPLFVGGTPLYLKSLLRGLFEGPPADWQLRHEIESELAQIGQNALHERLTQVDPVAASHIHPHDTRRLIRALEVYRATGEPISHQQLQFEEGRPAEECRVFVLRRPRAELHQRIEARVEAMVRSGLVDEVRGLVAGGHDLGRTARQAVGYREALEHLAGHYDHTEMAARILYRTRRFAKRQGTWFRSLSECRFVDVPGDANTNLLADEIAQRGRDAQQPPALPGVF
ncbi:MAG TPA: tRNA (adenosine(37)-N6)-dimethylallyltransferase MiaA [Lacipirellulaceae bacterium]|nr:tRNA (adenosine(37)-N6)-dimethylallyltransferase MiaA [Lacipirellulaceae bacterium]